MQAYLQNTIGCVANYSSTLAPAAYQILAGTLKADGFVTSQEEAQSFLSLYPDAGFVLTDPFTITGLPEPRAFAMARNVSLELVNDLAVALSTLREEGAIADLLAAYVPAINTNNGDISLGVSATGELRLRTAAIVVVSVTFALIGGLWLAGSSARAENKKRHEQNKESYASRFGGDQVSMDAKLGETCYMITTFHAERGRYTASSCSLISSTNPPLTCDVLPHSQVENLAYVMKLCQRGQSA